LHEVGDGKLVAEESLARSLEVPSRFSVAEWNIQSHIGALPQHSCLSGNCGEACGSMPAVWLAAALVHLPWGCGVAAIAAVAAGKESKVLCSDAFESSKIMVLHRSKDGAIVEPIAHPITASQKLHVYRR